MAAVTSAVIAAGALAYSITSSEQQKRMASQQQNAAKIDAATATNVAQAHQRTVDETQARNLDLQNQRARSSAAAGAASTGTGTAGAATTAAPSTIGGANGTLLGT